MRVSSISSFWTNQVCHPPTTQLLLSQKKGDMSLWHAKKKQKEIKITEREFFSSCEFTHLRQIWPLFEKVLVLKVVSKHHGYGSIFNFEAFLALFQFIVWLVDTY